MERDRLGMHESLNRGWALASGVVMPDALRGLFPVRHLLLTRVA